MLQDKTELSCLSAKEGRRRKQRNGKVKWSSPACFFRGEHSVPTWIDDCIKRGRIFLPCVHYKHCEGAEEHNVVGTMTMMDKKTVFRWPVFVYINEWCSTHKDSHGQLRNGETVERLKVSHQNRKDNVAGVALRVDSPDVIRCGWLGLKHQLTN